MAALTPKHRSLTAQVVTDFPGAAARGFRAAVNALCDELGMDRFNIGWIPDAYRINRETQEIEIYEVEVSHEIPDWKIEALGELWLDWEDQDEHDWLPVLIVVSRYGFRQRIDLMNAAYRTGPLAA